MATKLRQKACYPRWGSNQRLNIMRWERFRYYKIIQFHKSISPNTLVKLYGKYDAINIFCIIGPLCVESIFYDPAQRGSNAELWFFGYFFTRFGQTIELPMILVDTKIVWPYSNAVQEIFANFLSNFFFWYPRKTHLISKLTGNVCGVCSRTNILRSNIIVGLGQYRGRGLGKF